MTLAYGARHVGDAGRLVSLRRKVDLTLRINATICEEIERAL